MTKGRPPKPTTLKVLEGNQGHRAIGVPLATPEPLYPEPPAGLGKYGRKAWKEIGNGLYRLGLLTEADIHAFTLFCESHQRYREAKDNLKEEGMVVVTRNGARKSPWLAIIHQEYAIQDKLMAQFGMSPVARVRIVTNPEEGSDELDKLG